MASDPDNLPPLEPLVHWLDERALTLPLWIVLECARPFGWLLAQLCVVAQPLARGGALGTPLTMLGALLASPAALAALSEALAPGRERRAP